MNGGARQARRNWNVQCQASLPHVLQLAPLGSIAQCEIKPGTSLDVAVNDAISKQPITKSGRSGHTYFNVEAPHLPFSAVSELVTKRAKDR